ncbi:MAG: type II toxin-antitoxin system RelE/ParE family toxin [Terracidiphilus sp.]
MKRLRWSIAAAGDLEEIADYLYLHHPSLATDTLRRLYAAAKSLKKSPYIGRAGRTQGTRELVLRPLPYILVYSVDDAAIHILRFLHTSRDWRQPQ